MTTRETSLLEKMRDELHAYHSDILKVTTRLDNVSKNVEKIDVDLYGNPDDRETNPGVMSHVTKLRDSRKRMLLGLRGLWVVLTIIAGALVGKYFSS